MKSSTHVLRGALLLTLAGIISKVLSAIYRIPLQNLTGDLGYYIYQQVYPFIGTVMILSLYGFPVAVSKLTADAYLQQRPVTWKQFYFPLLVVLFLINGTIFLMIFFSAPMIAQLSGDTAFTSIYRVAAFPFLFVPLIALMRGSFQGIGEMTQTAYSQVIEQFLRVGIIISAAYFVFIEWITVQQIALAGVLATMVGMVAVTLFLLYFFRRHPYQPDHNEQVQSIPWRHLFYTCLVLGMVASINQLILIFIQFVDVVTLVPNLMEYGFTSLEAKKWKGVFDRGQPLIQFGVVIGASFALALIPAMARENAQLKRANLRTIQDALTLSFYLASGATVGLICILPEVNLLLFMDERGTFSLQVLAVSILITSIAMTGSAILLSENRWKYILYAISLMISVKYLLNELLIPSFGITGSAVATVTSLLLFLLLIVRRLKGIRFVRSIRWRAYISATFAMIVYLLFLKTTIYPILQLSRIGLLCYVLFIVTTGAFIYFILLLRYDGFSSRQISSLPCSAFLLKLKYMVKRK